MRLVTLDVAMPEPSIAGFPIWGVLLIGAGVAAIVAGLVILIVKSRKKK